MCFPPPPTLFLMELENLSMLTCNPVHNFKKLLFLWSTEVSSFDGTAITWEVELGIYHQPSVQQNVKYGHTLPFYSRITSQRYILLGSVTLWKLIPRLWPNTREIRVTLMVDLQTWCPKSAEIAPGYYVPRNRKGWKVKKYNACSHGWCQMQRHWKEKSLSLQPTL